MKLHAAAHIGPACRRPPCDALSHQHWLCDCGLLRWLHVWCGRVRSWLGQLAQCGTPGLALHAQAEAQLVMPEACRTRRFPSGRRGPARAPRWAGQSSCCSSARLHALHALDVWTLTAAAGPRADSGRAQSSVLSAQLLHCAACADSPTPHSRVHGLTFRVLAQEAATSWRPCQPRACAHAGR